ncbi:MAG: winged helix-turn-helix transcriptional regulator [Alphaproteobacteria bacterium]|nr:winged helix-turn-helix transcriptional regulator [Alphaproteobacteria bacterium]
MPPDVFDAIANPIRRDLLRLLAEGPKAVHELAAHFDRGRPAISEHLKVLRDVGLVADEAQGRHRIYRLDARPLRDVQDWVGTYERFWRDRMARLAFLLDEDDP